MKGYKRYDKDTFHPLIHYSRNAVHKRVKRGRMGQIAAAGAVGCCGFTMIGDVNIKSVENDIFLEKEIKNSC